MFTRDPPDTRRARVLDFTRGCGCQISPEGRVLLLQQRLPSRREIGGRLLVQRSISIQQSFRVYSRKCSRLSSRLLGNLPPSFHSYLRWRRRRPTKNPNPIGLRHPYACLLPIYLLKINIVSF
ncbi:hypothetical protein EJB05_43901 [Eragrostis curvula]|uniref:Uncharacterized protein n=1 Tax=Eragrostis curvula TaxID=38414 RepID=A0A5J9TG43_9POAL|nr:hypothetical protein EJB05_43901 [Eragrostis curvula]